METLGSRHRTLIDSLKWGVTFENAYLGSYPCMPARRDIWTGRYEFPWRGWGPLEYDDLDFIGLISDEHTTMLITDHYHLFEHGSGNYHFHFDGWEFIRGQENDKYLDKIKSILFSAIVRSSISDLSDLSRLAVG